jgi:hypothetical protein
MNEIEKLIERYNYISMTTPGQNQDDDMEWGSLCCQLTPLLLEKCSAQAATIAAQAERIRQLEAALTDAVGIAHTGRLVSRSCDDPADDESECSIPVVVIYEWEALLRKESK